MKKILISGLGGSLFPYLHYKLINNQTNNSANQISLPVSIIDDANGTTDYYEFYLKCDDTSGDPTLNSANRRTFFGAYRIIGA